jgi:hypothetical protein
MPGHKRVNYKAKWLAALDHNKISPANTAAETIEKLDVIHNVHIGTSVQVRKLQQTMIELALAVKSAGGLLDECQYVAGVDFGEVTHGIDGRLDALDAVIVARRARDIIRLLEVRVGFLAAAVETLDETSTEVANKISVTKTGADEFGKVAMSTLLIGPNPTQREADEYHDNTRSGVYRRFDVSYHDLPEDVSEVRMNAKSVLHQRNDSAVNLDDSSDDDQGSRSSSLASVNRRAQIVPRRAGLNL